MYLVYSKLEFLEKHVSSLLKIRIHRKTCIHFTQNYNSLKNMYSFYSELEFLVKHVFSLLNIRIPRKTCIQFAQN